MRAAIFLAYWPWFSPEEQVELAALADGLGLDSVWISEAAATLDVISGGRFRLGLGVSGPQVSEGWYGMPFARPVTRTREYVEIVRQVLARLVHTLAEAFDG